MFLTPNENKKLEIKTTNGIFCRYPIKTHFVAIGEDYTALIMEYVLPHCLPGDILSISEKIISLCQKRVVYKKDMKLSRLAKFLSRFASSSTAGIGVNSVWKMQFAIDHCGRAKIIFAAICSGIGKLFGKKGVFYDIAGMEVRGLDGFYDSAFKAYGDYGIRLPEDPTGVCEEIYRKTGITAMIVDANDYTVDILGKCSAIEYTDMELAEMISDNPAGQSNQCTPFVLIRKSEADVNT
jgi:hypothetical protein